MLLHDLEQRQRRIEVVAVVCDRLLHRLADRLQPREVDHGADLVFIEYARHRSLVGGIRLIKASALPRDALNALHNTFLAVRQIVQHDDVFPGRKQFHRRMRADEARAAGQQNITHDVSSKFLGQRIRRYSFPPRRRMPHFREGAQRRGRNQDPVPLLSNKIYHLSIAKARSFQVSPAPASLAKVQTNRYNEHTYPE